MIRHLLSVRALARPSNFLLRISARDMDKGELKFLWWLVKWALFWILVLLLFGVPILIF